MTDKKIGTLDISIANGISIQSQYNTLLGMNALGSYSDGTADLYIDELDYFTSALSDDDVLSLYNSYQPEVDPIDLPTAAKTYSFEENSLDSVSGNAASTVGTTEYVKGKIGLAARFAGSNYFDIGQIDYTNSFSYAFWLNVQSKTGDPSILGNQNWNSGSNPGWNISFDSSGNKLRNCIKPVDGTRIDQNPLSGDTAFAASTWHHVVMSFDRTAGTVNYYTDGVKTATLNASGTVGKSLQSDLTTKIGKNASGEYSDAQDIYMDEVNYYTSAISADQVTALYTAQSAASVGNLKDSFFTFDGTLANEKAFVDGTGTAKYADGKFDHGIKFDLSADAISFGDIKYDKAITTGLFIKPTDTVVPNTPILGNSTISDTTGWLIYFVDATTIGYKFGNTHKTLTVDFTNNPWTYLGFALDVDGETFKTFAANQNASNTESDSIASSEIINIKDNITMLGNFGGKKDQLSAAAITPFVADELLLKPSCDETVLDSEYTKTKDPFEFSFKWVAGETANTNSYYSVDLHATAPNSKKMYNFVDFTVDFDKSKMEIVSWDQAYPHCISAPAAIGGNRQLINKSLKDLDTRDFTNTIVARLVFKIKDGVSGPAPISLKNVKLYEGTSVTDYFQVASDHIVNAPTLNTNIVGNKAGDLNGDGVIGVGDVAKATDKQAVAAQAGIFPYKRVMVITLDGGGVAFDPTNGYFFGGATSADRNNPYCMDLFNNQSAVSYNVNAINPSWSAPNYGAILHGYQNSDVPVEYHLENGYTGNHYFYNYDTNDMPSFLKVIRDADPTRPQVTYTTWNNIALGVIEPNLGIGHNTTWDVTFNDTTNKQKVVNYIKSGMMKNTVVTYVQWDDIDHAGHDKTIKYFTKLWYDKLSEYDTHYKNVMDALKSQGLDKDTLVIFNADHGGGGAEANNHGGTTPQELRTMYAINGATVNKGKVLGAGSTMDTPAVVLDGLRLNHLKPESMSSSQVFDSSAYLTQKELTTKENRDIEKITATEQSDKVELKISNVKSSVNAVQMSFTLPEDVSDVTVTPAAGYTVYKKVVANGKLDLVVAGNTALTEGQVFATLTYNDFAKDDITITEVNLGTTDGTEIYCNLEETDEEDVILGDFNDNGFVDATDLVSLRKHILGLEVLNAKNLAKADMNDDKIISSTDLVILRKIILGINN